MTCDLFVFAGELSGDKLGALLIKELKKQNPSLKIKAVAGPKMREIPNVDAFMSTEKFSVLGFIDVFLNLPKIIYYFFKIKHFILKTNPKAIIFIDYPGFNLAMEKALRKKHFKGKLIHYVCPTVWAWKKNRIKKMSKTLDLLLCILPFEPAHFTQSPLKTIYIGHPLVQQIPPPINTSENIIGLFPGSRKEAILRNLPLQIKAVQQFLKNNENFKCAISLAHPAHAHIIKEMIPNQDFLIFPSTENYHMMKKLKLAIATSGTITLELALHNIPTIVTYAIKPLDLFIARKILKISLPHYCLVNIIANKEIFKEAYGPNFILENITMYINYFLTETNRTLCVKECQNIRNLLTIKNASEEAAKLVLECL